MRRVLRGCLWAAPVACAILLGSCTGASQVVALPQGSPSPAAPSPSPSPTPGPVVLTPSTLTFIATGSSAAQSVTVAQTNFSGAFSASTAAAGAPNSCSGIATVAASSATAFLVTPVAAGTCSETISGGGGVSATLSISVATTSVGGS